MRDLKNNLAVDQSISPAAKTADATGTGVDLQGFDAAMVLIHPGTISDGTHTPKLQESDDNSTFTDVASDDLEGSFENIATDTIQRVGYKGTSRYVRVHVAVSGATTGGTYGAAIVKGKAATVPVS